MRDRDVRKSLWDLLSERYKGDSRTLILHELGLRGGQSRVDIAVLNGSLHGFEIKSEQDTLDRLDGQIRIYGEVLDYVTIVCAAKHAERVTARVPVWWGITVATQAGAKVTLAEIRCARYNQDTNLKAVLELLWRDECLALLGSIEGAEGLRSATKEKLRARIVESMSSDTIREYVLDSLKSRRRWRDFLSPGTPSLVPGG